MRKHSTVPSYIFVDRDLAPLESVAEYLKEEKGLTYHEIAVLVGRNDRTIWTTYNRAKKKRQAIPKADPPSVEIIDIPLSIFKNRDFAPLESLSLHLKDVAQMSFHEIAVLINRDDRTIWTCYNRVQKKMMPN